MDRIVRILYLQSTCEIGGSDVSLLRMVSGLDRTRFHPCVALPRDGPMADRLRRLGCEIFLIPEMLKLTTRRGRLYLVRYLLNYPRAVLKIARLIRREKIDVVHSNSLHNLYGFSAAALTRRGHIWHAREIVTQSGLLRRAEAFLARRFSFRLLVTSDAVGTMFQDRAGVYPSNLRKLPDSIELRGFHPDNSGGKIRDSLAIPRDALLVGLVGRLDEGKGVDVFLRAAALCRPAFPQARFLVVGGPIEGQEAVEGELKNLAASLGLGSTVQFTSWRFAPGDMPSLHAALDILVSASRRPEGFGLSILEAMAGGKPVVATRHGGPVEICSEDETALLTEPENPEALTAALLALLSDPQRRRAMGTAGRLRAERLFAREPQQRRLESFYQEAL